MRILLFHFFVGLPLYPVGSSSLCPDASRSYLQVFSTISDIMIFLLSFLHETYAFIPCETFLPGAALGSQKPLDGHIIK